MNAYEQNNSQDSHAAKKPSQEDAYASTPQTAQTTDKDATEPMTRSLSQNNRAPRDKRQWLKIGKWVWVVHNEDQYRQARFVAMVLEEEKEGEIKLVYRNRYDDYTTDFHTGIFSVADLIPLSNCTGWDYSV